MGTIEVTVSFVKEDGVTPMPVFWSEKPLLQQLSKLLPLQYREKFANTTFVRVNMPEDITVRGMLQDLRDRGVISAGEAVHSKVLIELKPDQKLFGRLVRNGSNLIVVLRPFALIPA